MQKLCELSIANGILQKLGIAKANDFHGCDYYGKDLHDARNLLALLRKMVNDTKQPTEVK